MQLQRKSATADDDSPKEQENTSALYLPPEQLEQKIHNIIEENKELRNKLDSAELSAIMSRQQAKQSSDVLELSQSLIDEDPQQVISQLKRHKQKL